MSLLNRRRLATLAGALLAGGLIAALTDIRAGAVVFILVIGIALLL
jgi:hypothetical protein